MTISARLASVDDYFVNRAVTTVAMTLVEESTTGTLPLRCNLLACFELRQLGLERKNFFVVRRIGFQNRSVVV